MHINYCFRNRSEGFSPQHVFLDIFTTMKCFKLGFLNFRWGNSGITFFLLVTDTIFLVKKKKNMILCTILACSEVVSTLTSVIFTQVNLLWHKTKWKGIQNIVALILTNFCLPWKSAFEILPCTLSTVNYLCHQTWFQIISNVFFFIQSFKKYSRKNFLYRNGHSRMVNKKI